MALVPRFVVAVALGCAAALLASCGDCFFTMKGRLVECGTTAPVPGATISVHIDDGIHGARTLMTTFTSDDAGGFKVTTGGSEVCSATATLTITREGFMPLQQQFKGAPKATAELCMTRSAASP
jgi:hypothetical protein